MAKARVAVIGAGLGGLCAAAKLKEAGHTEIVILEKADSVGGTWRDNQYPGCACDTPVALYQFSFFPSIKWNYLFPRAAEVHEYARDMAQAFGLSPHLRLGDEAVSAVWDEAAKTWTVKTKSGAAHVVDAIVPALGQLNRPQWPAIPGRECFSGPSMHSARWNPAVDLKGKRVACIGSAASAVQLIPEVAEIAGHLSVFQRTPNWVISRLDRGVSEEEKALLLTDIDAAMKLGAMNRQLIYDNADYFFWQAFAWTQAGRAALTRQALDKLDREVPDPDLRKKLTPDYPIGCKRILITDDFLPAMSRPNVSLVTEAIEEITETGVRTKDGAAHAFDVIIYATGFETTGWQWSVDVVGEGGVRLADVWREAPEAYLGITAAQFPNMFMLYGPNTNLGHNTITFMIEQQVRYLVDALGCMEVRGAKAMTPKKDAQIRFNADLQAKLAHSVWADPGCASWYKTADGRITQNWGDHTRAYAEATAAVRLEDYTFS
jgi:cation diffusion facilitator CzcD-associated flavoprotein CzcO